jgi:anti-anti-sigma factor
MELKLDIQADSTAVAGLAGRLDLVSAGEVKLQLGQVIADGHRNLVVDLADVPFIDSSGLGALISALKAARIAGGDMRIARPGEQARLVLNLTTLDRVLHPYATVEEALADL